MFSLGIFAICCSMSPKAASSFSNCGFEGETLVSISGAMSTSRHAWPTCTSSPVWNPSCCLAAVFAAAAPLEARRAQPAVLIDLAVQIRIDLAKDLDPILIEAPHVHFRGVFAGEIPAQDLLAAIDQLDADAFFFAVENAAYL